MGYTRKPYGRHLYARNPYVRSPYGAAPDSEDLIFYAPLLSSLDEVYGAIPTFTRASTGTYLGPSGLIETAAINEPRFEYDTGGGARGYLVEGQRTNLALRSEESDNPVWAKTNIIVNANDGTAPDGTTTADRLTATAANATIIQDLGVLASVAYTYSVWIERVTGSGAIELTIDNGTTWTPVTVTSSLVRLEITQTVSNPDVGIRIVASGDEIRVWGHDAEAGAFASSYIPTVGSAVTRVDDDLRYPLSALDATQDHSWMFEVQSQGVGAATAGMIQWSNSPDRFDLRWTLPNATINTVYRTVAGNDDAAAAISPFDNFRFYRCACTINSGVEYRTYFEGSQEIAQAVSAAYASTGSEFGIGNSYPIASGSPLFGHVRNVRIYQRVLGAGEV